MTEQATIMPHAAAPELHAHAASLVNQGIAVHQQGRVLEAEPFYRDALKLVEDHPDALHMLAVVHSQKGQQAEAERLVRRALQVLPDNTAYHNTLGRVLLLQNRFDEGLQSLERALELAPQNPEAHYNLGDAMLAQGKAREAETRFRRALQLKPSHAMAAYGLGRALWVRGDEPGALPWFQLASLQSPADLTLQNQLAVAYMALGHRDDALAAFERLLAAAPNSPEVQCNVGVLHGHNNRLKAIEHFIKALQLQPTMPTAQDGYIEIARQLCLWDDFLATTTANALAGVRERLASGQGAQFRAFTALYLPFTAEEKFAVARSESLKLAYDAGEPLHGEAARRDGRLRIGYVSADARNHPVGHLLQGMFELHDRERFEIFFYSTGVDDGSPQRRAIQGSVEHFIEARGVTSAELAQRIAADGVQVLVDLMGHTADSRMAVLARRPAPVQMHYLGFPGSTGADFVDYLIVDPVLMPPERRELRSEAAIYLPVYQVNSHRSLPPGPTYRRRDFGLGEDWFLYYTFNNNYKIDPEIYALWMRVLKAVPRGRLALLATDAKVVERLRGEARRHGVDPDRLLFAGYMDQPSNLARQKLMDLFLDTPAYNAGATAADALWSGTPLLTTRGDTYITRVGESLLHHLGLDELVTPDLQTYERLAIELAEQPGRLAELKRKLAAALPSASLYDTAGQVRRIEEGYSRAWNLYANGNEKQDITLA
ncbi:TPR repeat-containing protein YrrB [mine drainage metagenome]|uniref:protein O-GlcNAc transferase n=1 Tax=mine drainage metagenome TaxID=410659 RepID=A0A1J5R053_9ZZZZ